MLTPTAGEQLTDLERTLDQILSTVEHQRVLLATQREVVATADLDRLLATIEEQEVSNARLAQLETRRQELQRSLERHFGVEGLRAVVDAGCSEETTRRAGFDRAERLGASVGYLQREQQQAAALLTAAAAAAARTRAYLIRLAGAAPSYGPAGIATEAQI